MIPFLCFRCTQISISFEGLRCFHCDNDESRRTENVHPPVPEPRNVSPGYYLPTAEASTQTVEEDFILPEPHTLTTREASTQTTDSDFNILAQTVGCRGHENGAKNDVFSQSNTFQNFDKDFNANPTLISANPSTNEDDSNNLSDKDARNSVAIEPLFEAMDDPYVEGTPSIFASLRRSPSHDGKRFPENLRAGKALAEHWASTSRDLSRKKFFARCGKCRKKFFSEAMFNAHMQNNCDPNPFKCDKCDEKFHSEYRLRRHQPMHTGKTPFKCNQCDYASAYPFHLNKHLKSHNKKR